MAPEALARALGERDVYAWHGHNYAIEPLRALGLLESGGVLRVGLVHYNTHEEIDRFVGYSARSPRALTHAAGAADRMQSRPGDPYGTHAAATRAAVERRAGAQRR